VNSDRSAICETSFYSTCMDVIGMLLDWNGLIDWITIACYISSVVLCTIGGVIHALRNEQPGLLSSLPAVMYLPIYRL